jgi:RNA polymerase sigma-70 factor (ECF subfamily)
MTEEESKTDETSRRWGELMTAAQKGDQAAYGTFLKEVTPYITRIVNSKVKFLDQTDDIVQNILISIHKARHTYDPGKSIKPWIVTITRRRMIDTLRKTEKERSFDSIDDMDPAAPEEPEADEKALHLDEAVAALPEKFREPITLVKLQGYKAKEAATKLGISESALKTRCSRGYKLLRKYIEKRL